MRIHGQRDDLLRSALGDGKRRYVLAGERWLQRLARLRVERDDYRWPIEMKVLQLLRPAKRLS